MKIFLQRLLLPLLILHFVILIGVVGYILIENYSFLDEIKRMKLYPLTSLRSIPRHVKHDLLKNNIVLITELLDRKELLRSRGFSDAQIERTFEEIRILEGLI